MGRILVVDDDRGMLRFVARVLETGGHVPHVVDDPVEGRHQALHGDHDLVVLDLTMPKVDGMAILTAMAAERPDHPVLVLSASRAVEVRVRCLDLGASDFLQKPFAVAELLARVGARLREHAAAPMAVLAVGELRLDLRRQRATLDQRPVTLSAREFTLLAHLVRRAGQICTREQLLADVWGLDFDPGSNVVDVYISRLRSKLGARTSSGSIETVRNVGYSFASVA